MNKKTRKEKGQAIVMIAMAIVGLVGFTALAIDGGNAYSDRRHAQNAADTAALSAALAKVRSNDWYAIGQNIANSNGFNDDGITNIVDLYSPPTEGPYAGNDEYVQVIITSHVDTFFAPVVGVEQVTNRVEAVARAKPPTVDPNIQGNAMISLAPTECQAVYIHGTAATTLTGGGIFVNSNGEECTNPNNGAFEHQGSALVSAVDGGVSSVGDAVVQNPALLNPYPPTEGALPLNPDELILPPMLPADCATASTQSGSTLTPGTVAASWLRANVFLQPGSYCISGDLVLNASNTLEGQDVTLFFMDGGLHINGSGNFLLDAPDSGPYAGLLIYLPPPNNNSVVLNGDATSEFTGTILAPISEVQINGTGYIDAYNCQVIGYNIDLIGTADTYINYDDSNVYVLYTQPKIELSQ